jgi:hypothetical protein
MYVCACIPAISFTICKHIPIQHLISNTCTYVLAGSLMMRKLWRRFSADEKTIENERDRIEIKLRYTYPGPLVTAAKHY